EQQTAGASHLQHPTRPNSPPLFRSASFTSCTLSLSLASRGASSTCLVSPSSQGTPRRRPPPPHRPLRRRSLRRRLPIREDPSGPADSLADAASRCPPAAGRGSISADSTASSRLSQHS
uniref:Uncharacterized protein n=1 Tax=Oryza punctata TaxID=4537 RepID=A0A0E0LRY3_ORYPU